MGLSTELMTIDAFRSRPEIEADDVDAAGPGLRPHAAEARHGETVVIKRRRRQMVGVTAQRVPHEAGDAHASRQGSGPKVHLLKSARVPASAPAPQPESSLKPRRRRPDSVRAPRLVAHLVFERPQRAAQPAADTGDPLDFSLPGDAQYRAIGRALARLREVLDSARSASRWRPRP